MRATSSRAAWALAGVVLAALTIAISLWQRSLQGGPNWAAADVVLGAAGVIAAAAAGVSIAGALLRPAQEVFLGAHRRAALTGIVVGFLAVTATALVRWTSYSFASNVGGSSGPAGEFLSLLLDAVLALAGWTAAFLIALSVAGWINTATRKTGEG